jgi:hypothetical protein
MLSETEFKLVASSVAAGGKNTICYLDITPQYEGSKIHVEFCFSYSALVVLVPIQSSQKYE